VEFVSPPSRGLNRNIDNDEGNPLHCRKQSDVYAFGSTPLGEEEQEAAGEELLVELLVAVGAGVRPHMKKPSIISVGSRP
jgi:hypothetical protein